MKKINHDEITPVILLNTALDYFLFSCDAASMYPLRNTNDPISVLENSHASVSFLLLSNSIEGYLNRLIYLRYKGLPVFKDITNQLVDIDRKFLEFLKFSDSYSEIKEKFDEVYTIRNSIIHSHIYRTERTEERIIKSAEKLILKQDPRWMKSVGSNFKTNKLNLNAIPSEICFDDITKAFDFWDLFYTEVNKYEKSGYLPPVYPHVYRRFHVKDFDIIEKIDSVTVFESLFAGWVRIGKEIAKRK